MRQAWLVLLIACGNVQSKSDAANGDGAAIDGPSGCTVHNTVDSCGASCAKCSVTSDREIASCDGTACGFTCKDSAPKCTDGSCSRLIWNFDDGALDGITPASALTQLAVRAFNGNNALAMDVQNLTEVSFTVPLCLSTNTDLRSKTVTAIVFFQGGTATGDQYYVQGSIPSPMNGAFLTQMGVASGVFVTFTSPTNMSTFSGASTTLTFQAGTFGAQFSGTIWFDDIKIQ